MGRGEVMEHWLRDLLFWPRILASYLTGSRPCLCDVLVPAHTATCVTQRARDLIEKKIDDVRDKRTRAPPGIKTFGMLGAAFLQMSG